MEGCHSIGKRKRWAELGKRAILCLVIKMSVHVYCLLMLMMGQRVVLKLLDYWWIDRRLIFNNFDNRLIIKAFFKQKFTVYSSSKLNVSGLSLLRL